MTDSILIDYFEAGRILGEKAAEKNLHVEDGWIYFIHGWTQVIAEVFHIEIDSETLKNLSDIAKQA